MILAGGFTFFFNGNSTNKIPKSAKIMARELVRTRKAKARLHASKANLRYSCCVEFNAFLKKKQFSSVELVCNYHNKRQ